MFCFVLTVQAKVVSSYKTSLDDELKLDAGDIVRGIQMTGDRYWTGNLKGERGHFPKYCVELLLKGNLMLVSFV